MACSVVRPSSLSNEVFRVGGEGHTDILLCLQLSEGEDFALPQCVKVKHSDSWLLSFVCDSSIAFVWTDSLKGRRKDRDMDRDQ